MDSPTPPTPTPSGGKGTGSFLKFSLALALWLFGSLASRDRLVCFGPWTRVGGSNGRGAGSPAHRGEPGSIDIRNWISLSNHHDGALHAPNPVGSMTIESEAAGSGRKPNLARAEVPPPKDIGKALGATRRLRVAPEKGPTVDPQPPACGRLGYFSLSWRLALRASDFSLFSNSFSATRTPGNRWRS